MVVVVVVVFRISVAVGVFAVVVVHGGPIDWLLQVGEMVSIVYCRGHSKIVHCSTLLVLTMREAISARAARSEVSSSSCCAFLNLARLRAAISSASSICCLYVLILVCSLAASSDILMHKELFLAIK